MQRHLNVYPIKQTAIRAGIAAATELERAGVAFMYDGSRCLLTDEAAGTKTLFVTERQVIDGDLRGLMFDSMAFHGIANEAAVREALVASRRGDV